MSRIARRPVNVPKGVEVNQNGNVLTIKGPKGEFQHSLHASVKVVVEENTLRLSLLNKNDNTKPILGTTNALLNNLINGVHKGFEKKLTLVGVGYRAKAKDSTNLELTLGYSHPVLYVAPKGISLETPSNTEIIVKGADKQKVGQVAAELRSLRAPELYKGKGVRYSDEQLILKETKKK